MKDRKLLTIDEAEIIRAGRNMPRLSAAGAAFTCRIGFL